MQVRDIDNIRSVDTIRTATRDNQSPCHFVRFWIKYAAILSGIALPLYEQRCVDCFFSQTVALWPFHPFMPSPTFCSPFSNSDPPCTQLQATSARAQEFNVATYKHTYYLLDARGDWMIPIWLEMLLYCYRISRIFFSKCFVVFSPWAPESRKIPERWMDMDGFHLDIPLFWSSQTIRW